MKRTKIVATMGPASCTAEKLTTLIKEGLNVARLNFSHGDHAMHEETIRTIRAVDEALGTHTSILADLQGPKLRIGDLEGGSIELHSGETLEIRTGREIGQQGRVYTTYFAFAQDVKPGERVLLDDGKIELKVRETNGVDAVTCEVIHGGTLKPRKGINLPQTAVSLPIWRSRLNTRWTGSGFRSCAKPRISWSCANASVPPASTRASSRKSKSRKPWANSRASWRRPMR
jgi:pyruvate kinase